jgi:hypothetical protein
MLGKSREKQGGSRSISVTHIVKTRYPAGAKPSSRQPIKKGEQRAAYGWALNYSPALNTTSTRLFKLLPLSVLLSAMGCSLPNPLETMRSEAIPN